MATFLGTIFNDSLVGGLSNDLILGYAGNDTLQGNEGNDTIDGGDGDDGISGGEGNNTIYGGDGDDGISGGEGNDTIYGGAGNDTIFGLRNAGSVSVIYGGAGNDLIYAKDGNDSIYGETGNDSLVGWDGNDIIDGGAGNDELYGGSGNDIIDGGAGNDTAFYYEETFAQSRISKRGTVVSVNGDTLRNVELLDFTDRTINVSSIPDANAPRISINDISITEGNSGTTNAVFTVRLDRISQQPVSVNFATANGTASSSSDYNTARGTVRFNPGVINQTVSVGVKGDTILEPNETFSVNLSSATNAFISDSLGVATIVNDDLPLPRLSINSLSVFEGNNRNNVALTVTLTGPTSQRVSANFATANGSAIASSDYVPTTGNVTFNASNAARQTKTIQIPIVGDSLFERDETFSVNLANAVNATLGTSRATVTVRNDDNPPVRNSVIESLPFQSLDTPSLGKSKSPIIDKSLDSFGPVFTELAVNDTII
jgi:hypothetical protein